MAERHTETESTFPHVKVAFDDFVITGIFSTIMKYVSRVKARWIHAASSALGPLLDLQMQQRDWTPN